MFLHLCFLFTRQLLLGQVIIEIVCLVGLSLLHLVSPVAQQVVQHLVDYGPARLLLQFVLIVLLVEVTDESGAGR